MDSSSTQEPSVTASSPPSAQPSSSAGHWLPLSIGKLGAYAIAFKVSWHLPVLYTDPSVSATTKAVATIFVLAVAAPTALRDAVSAFGLIRNGGGKQ